MAHEGLVSQGRTNRRCGGTHYITRTQTGEETDITLQLGQWSCNGYLIEQDGLAGQVSQWSCSNPALRHTSSHSHNTTEHYRTLHNIAQHNTHTAQYNITHKLRTEEVYIFYHQTRLRTQIITHLSIHKVGNYNKHTHVNTHQSPHKQMSSHSFSQWIR